MGTTFVITVIAAEHDALGPCMGKIQVFLNWWAKEFGYFIGIGESLKLND